MKMLVFAVLALQHNISVDRTALKNHNMCSARLFLLPFTHYRRIRPIKCHILIAKMLHIIIGQKRVGLAWRGFRENLGFSFRFCYVGTMSEALYFLLFQNFRPSYSFGNKRERSIFAYSFDIQMTRCT